MRNLGKFLIIASAAGLLGLGCASRVVGSEAGPKELFEARCSKCHKLDKVLNRTMSAEQWRTVVDKMKDKWFSGISDEEAGIIADYLGKTRSN